MGELFPNSQGRDDEHLAEPPIVDALQLDRSHNTWVVTLIPEDLVSTREKELVTIPLTSPDGRRITLRVRRLSLLLGMNISGLFHGGDGDFVFVSEAGERRTLAQPQMQIDLSIRVYVELSDIAMTAQIAFACQAPAATVP
ncbi:MAG TPA: hypothetical protein PLD59_07665 [Tepidisphaeraceae bacterium]|nr:hypothetical protein [Tepidisphaeraceae bacterium]